jgi:hypothetical protein
MPTINRGDDYFQAVTYTGNGSTNTITGLRFQPDFVWVKGRSGATDHALYDSVRGTTKDLVSNSTAAETTQATGLTAFNSDGFTLGALAKMNTNTATYVAWCWKAGGTTSSNTNGSITSTVSVNATAGFSVVTYTGTGANATVGHGLGVAPKMIIVKGRSIAESWRVGHNSVNGGSSPWNYYMALNLTNAAAAASTVWNNTAPTSSVFSIGTDSAMNSNTNTYVAYCWAEIAGFSKFGSYTGNGSADGPFVYTGFRPKFIMRKQITDNGDVGNWIIFDTSRDTYNVATRRLLANSSNAEATPGNNIDVLSNGWKERNSDGYSNASGQSYIYMAFAENPFKNSLAR